LDDEEKQVAIRLLRKLGKRVAEMENGSAAA
jgi:hypothetical protein